MPNSNSAGPTAFQRALEKLLRPLVRILLHQQVTYPQLSNLLKSIYVDVAEKEMRVGDKRQSDSRINLLTGVHRKDVKRLRAEPHLQSSIPATVSTGAQLIAHWLGTAEYTDDQGKPLPLPLKSAQADGMSFEKLVSSVVKQDIRPRVILDEWLRLNIAHLENDQLVLNTGAFTPEKGFDEKAFFFGKNLHDHISAGASNLMGQQPSYFDRSVYYDKLSVESVRELNKLADQLGMEALTKMNRAALLKQQADAERTDATYRMNFGIFNYDSVQRSGGNDHED